MKNLAIASVLLIGCGAEPSDPGPEILDGLDLPPPPENGLRIITPITEGIEAGTDNEFCIWTDQFLERETDIKSTQGYQNEPPGHHAVLYYTTEKQPPGTMRKCTDTDMMTFRFLTGNGGEGELNSAPGNLVYRAPAGAQLVINAHYLNYTENVMRAQTAIDVNFAEPGGEYIASGSLAFLDSSINVPQGESTFETTCNIDRTMKLWYVIPHMHRWGSKITVDLTKGANTERLFDTLWDPSFTFHPPEIRLDPSEPMTINPGDQLKVTCSWNNTENRDLPFGFEMCVSYAQFVDEQETGSWACDGGNWVTF